MVETWQLNAIMLAHVQRFFHAAYEAAALCHPQTNAKVGLALALLGNIIWAKSPYVTDNRQDEHDMAMTGALLGTLGGELPDAPNNTLVHSIEALERSIYASWDDILDAIDHGLAQHESIQRSPQAVNQFVWKQLFPHDNYGSFLALVAQLHKRLTLSTSVQDPII